MNHCKKCQRIFKINKSLFMCKKCKYSLCGDCYQPSLTLKSKIHRQQKIVEKIKSDQNIHVNGNSNGNNHSLSQPQQSHLVHHHGIHPLNGNVSVHHHHNINIIPLSPPHQPIISALNQDHLGEDENGMYFDNDQEQEDDEKKIEFSDLDGDDEEDEEEYHEEEEKKMIVLTDDHLAQHNNNNYHNYGPIPVGPPPQHQYSQSFHSYSHSNSHQSHSTSNRSQNNTSSRSKSRDRGSS